MQRHDRVPAICVQHRYELVIHRRNRPKDRMFHLGGLGRIEGAVPRPSLHPKPRQPLAAGSIAAALPAARQAPRR